MSTIKPSPLHNVKPASPSPMRETLITKVARFGNDSTGLEKILRLFQALCMIAVSLLLPADAAPFKQGIKSLGLGRRYLRFFKFFPLLDNFWALSARQSSNGALHLLAMGKVGFGALYLLGQNVTTLDAMGVYRVDWASKVMLEANRFWFYSLTCSVLLTLHALWSLPSSSIPEVGEGSSFSERTKAGLERRKTEELTAKNGEKRKKLMEDLLMYGADLFIPGDLTGWIRMEGWFVGSAMVVSTLLASGEIWESVN